ncbi:MAG: hypothetical protein AB7U73_23865 [Pirellulales bacterium]|uniref:hypothetical protein n=1 Tax=Bradyrhizobium sp. TaxID=376 RepID=UPI003D0CB113
MRVVKPYEWEGTKQALLDRVDAFKAARTAHAESVGEPAPLEDPIVEELAKRDVEVVLASELDVDVVEDEIEQALLDRKVAERIVMDGLIAQAAAARDAPDALKRAAAAIEQAGK